MNEKAKKIFSGVGRGCSVAVVILEVIVILFLVISKIQGVPPTLFGHQMYFIVTGSMSPYLAEKDIIISKKYDGGELRAGEDGDVVTYYGEVGGKPAMITHRVISVDGDKVITKGDAPGVTADSPIAKDDIEAVMVYKTVVLDKIYKVISNAWGFWLLVFTPIALLIIAEIVSLVKEIKKEKEGADENGKEEE